jgi:hypothetical protein
MMKDGEKAPLRTVQEAFKPPPRGRPPLYCCASHRQQAYEKRRAYAAAERLTPSLLLGRDIDAMQTKAGIERAVVDVLRKLGFLLPKPKEAPRLSLVKDNDE